MESTTVSTSVSTVNQRKIILYEENATGFMMKSGLSHPHAPHPTETPQSTTAPKEVIHHVCVQDR